MLLCLGALVSFVSCDKWLGAMSSTKIPGDEMFSTKEGFYDALSGIYIAMGDADCYGQNYTWFVNELTAYPYQYQINPVFESLQNHSYDATSVKPVFASMWKQGYFVIANINMVLRELEERKDVVTSDVEYNLIKGELLGLRAYIHFDLMRMFGLGDWSGENAAKLTVPYVTVYSKDVTPQLSYAGTAELLMKDIDDALKCLESNDPVTGNVSKDIENQINREGFWDNRTKHLNYYAVKALAARVCQWMGDLETAAGHAQEVVDGALGGGKVAWTDVEAQIQEASLESRDWTFSTEHLFSLEVTSLGDEVNDYIFSSMIPVISLDNGFVDFLFPSSDEATGNAGIEDVRGTAFMLRSGTYGYTCYKYYNSSAFSTNFSDLIPMVKISEMYYIIAENDMAGGRTGDAIAAIDQVRLHRGITVGLPADIDLESELVKEYYREFMGEGQLFYYFKRKGFKESITDGFAVKASDLIYPYPDDETDYGRKQEL